MGQWLQFGKRDRLFCKSQTIPNDRARGEAPTLSLTCPILRPKMSAQARPPGAAILNPQDFQRSPAYAADYRDQTRPT